MWDGMPDRMAGYLERHINAIPEEERTENGIFKQRLQVCKKCDKFQEGLCRACGCYVSLRAAAKKQKCPYRKWGVSME